MTVATFETTLAADRPRILVEPAFAAAGVAFLLMIPPTLAALLADDRLHLGVDIWTKPLKFQVALAIFCFTMSAYARWLPEGVLAARWWRRYVVTVVAAMVAEITWITGAAALGTSSHFNTSPVGMGLYALMGVLAVWFTASTLVLAWQIARNRRADVDPALRTGLVLGLVLTFLLSVAFAGYMSNSGGHLVGTASERLRPLADGLVADGGRPPRGALLRHARDARAAGLRLRRRAGPGAALVRAAELGLRAGLRRVLRGGLRPGARRPALPAGAGMRQRPARHAPVRATHRE